MKTAVLWLCISFIFYLIGHLIWTIFTIIEGNADFKFWIISVPFAIFSIFGFFASFKLYKNER